MNHTTLWIGFTAIVLIMLIIDLGVFNKKAHEVKMKEALIWSAVWITLALLFNVWIYFQMGQEAALRFLTGYLLEKSLSVDNLFVFILIFSFFNVKSELQHKVLFWGIIGALVMRAVFIALGVTLIERFHAIIYIFGAFLIYTGIKLALEKDKEVHPENNPVLRIFKKFMGVTETYEGDRFFVKRAGRWLATPLFVVLLVVETTDVVFAVDSIPAILAITTDPFLVYSSNVFAILGLRALYFALAGLMKLFHYLHYGLAIILVFVGSKMIISSFYKVPIGVALGVILLVLAGSVVLSLMFPKKEPALPV
jgi:tellurite resistance protein TerC